MNKKTYKAIESARRYMVFIRGQEDKIEYEKSKEIVEIYNTPTGGYGFMRFMDRITGVPEIVLHAARKIKEYEQK